MAIKRNLSLLYLTLITLAFAVPAQAQSNWYFSGSGGATFATDVDFSGALNGSLELDPGYNVGIAFGGTISNNLRGEIEVSYHSVDLDKVTASAGSASLNGEIKTAAIMFNGYYDINTGSSLAPYITAELGYARQEIMATIASTSFDDSDTGLVYQVGVGASYAVSDTTNLFVDYHYFGSRDYEINNTEFDGYGAHEIRVGVRFGF